MNLPNKLTVARLVLTILFVVITGAERLWPANAWWWPWTLATVVFTVASITDFLDGAIARKRGLVTTFGQLMDPLADKVLMAAAFVMLVQKDTVHVWRDGTLFTAPGLHLPAWIVVAILAREFLVTGLRLVATSRGVVLAAEKGGKAKVGWQIACVCYFLVFYASHEAPVAWWRPMFDWPIVGRQFMEIALPLAMLLSTLWSGLGYFWKNRTLVFSDM